MSSTLDQENDYWASDPEASKRESVAPEWFDFCDSWETYKRIKAHWQEYLRRNDFE